MRPERGVAGSSPRLADQHLWSAEDDMAAEGEIGDLIYGLIRALKPALVVETGSYHCTTFTRMMRAVEDNGFGKLVGCDPVLPKASSGARWSLLACRSEDVRETIERCDLIFSDSDPEARKDEFSWLKRGAIAVVHDTCSHPDLGIFVRHQGGILFDTPRGFGIIRK